MKVVAFLVMGVVILTACASSDPMDDYALRNQVKNESDTLAIAPYEAQRAYNQSMQDIAEQKAAQKAAGH